MTSKKIHYFIFIFIFITNFTLSDEINYKIYPLKEGQNNVRLVNQGREFVCYGFNQSIIDVRDIYTGELKKSYECNTNWTKYFENSMNQNYWLATTAELVDSFNTQNEKAVIWKNGTILYEIDKIDSHEKILCGTLSPDEKIFAIGLFNGNLEIYNTDTGKFYFNCIPQQLNPIIDPSYPLMLNAGSVYFSDEGDYILSRHSDLYARMWSAKDGKLLSCFRTMDDFGKTLFQANSTDNMMKYEWNNYDKIVITDIESNNKIIQFTYKIIISGNNLIQKGLTSPDQKYHLEYDESNARILIRDITAGKELLRLNNMNKITSAEFTPDSRMILLGDEKFRAIVVDLTALYPSGANKTFEYK